MVDGNPNDEQRIREDCVKIWRILVERAPDARSIFYSDLGAQIGVSTKELTESGRLPRIHRRCNVLGLAPLDVLVVLKGHWVPSKGYRDTRRQEADFPREDELICYDRNRVRNTDWSRVSEPNPEDFGA